MKRIIPLLPLLVVALACAAEEPEVTETGGEITPPGVNALPAPATTTQDEALAATAGEIVSNPAQYAARVVTVTGEVEQVASGRAFTIDTGMTPGELLVVSETKVPGVTEGTATRDLIAEDDVIVTGRVLQLPIVDLEREIGWDLERELELEFENQPVLVVDTMSATPGEATQTTGG